MKTALDFAKLLAYCAFIVLLGECAYAVHKVRVPLAQAADNANTALIAIEDAAVNLDGASQQWQTTQQQVAKDSTNVLIETRMTLARFRSFAASTDVVLNSLLSQSTTAIDQQNQSLLETQAKLRESLTAMNQATMQLQGTLASADRVISSPELQKSLASLAESSQHTSEATAHLAATTKDVQQVADAFRSDYLKPKNRAVAYLKAILGLGSQGRILFNK